jgi:hypothetical protein
LIAAGKQFHLISTFKAGGKGTFRDTLDGRKHAIFGLLRAAKTGQVHLFLGPFQLDKYSLTVLLLQFGQLLNGPYKVRKINGETVVDEYPQNCVYDKSMDLMVRTCNRILPGQEAVVSYGNDSKESMFGIGRKRKLDSSDAKSGPTPAKRDRSHEKSKAMGRELRLILDLSNEKTSGPTTANRDRAAERSRAMKHELKQIMDSETSKALRSTTSMQQSLRQTHCPPRR